MDIGGIYSKKRPPQFHEGSSPPNHKRHGDYWRGEAGQSVQSRYCQYPVSTYKMRIVLVEDAMNWIEEAVDMLETAFPGVDVVTFGNESAFMEVLNAPDQLVCDLFIFDMAVGWSPSFDLGAEGEPEEAGLRLAAKVKSVAQLSKTPIIFWSALDPRTWNHEMLPRPAITCAKGSDLVECVYAVLLCRGVSLPGKPLGRELVDSIDAKIGGWGVTLDVKKAWAAVRRKFKGTQ